MDTPHLTAEALRECYDRYGFVILPQFLSIAECVALKNEAIRLIRREGTRGTVILGLSSLSPLFYRLGQDARICAETEPSMGQAKF